MTFYPYEKFPICANFVQVSLEENKKILTDFNNFCHVKSLENLT